MTNVTRRTVVQGGLAAAAAIAAPSVVRAQARPPAARTVRLVPHGDVPTYDPIWTTANMAAYHGGFVYDTLFGLDAKMQPQPQMVSKYGASDDKLTWTFELRDGLKWHDGTAVTTADIVPSIRRWSVRDGFGQHMMQRVKDISAKDEKTFTIELKERYGLIIEALAKTATPVCFMMRKKEAETDPMQKIDQVVGSGPFKLNQNETKPGTQYVYDKNPDYVPRSEPASGMTGGKVVKVDRVIMVNMPDAQTAVASLQSGEIDFYETPPIDFIDQLQSDRNIKIQRLNELGQMGVIRLNFLHPPFDNVKCRQAMLYVVKQDDHMKATYASDKYYRTCPSLFTCASPMESDVNTGWFKGGQNFAKARELLKEGGYDGRPVVLLQATNIAYMNNSAQILAEEMRKAGINVQVESMDWSNVVQRRSNKNAPQQGGWNVFITAASGTGVASPMIFTGHQANGEKGWFGWPKDDKHEELRTAWAAAETLEQRKEIARQIQENAWNYVPQVWFGQWFQPAAYRTSLTGILPVPDVLPWWNVEKKA